MADLKDRATLDTPPEPAYDDLTKLASHICNAMRFIKNPLD